MSGLLALLDDVAGIAKVAATSVDDVVAAAGKAGAKTAGVIIDDRNHEMGLHIRLGAVSARIEKRAPLNCWRGKATALREHIAKRGGNPCRPLRRLQPIARARPFKVQSTSRMVMQVLAHLRCIQPHINSKSAQILSRSNTGAHQDRRGSQ